MLAALDGPAVKALAPNAPSEQQASMRRKSLRCTTQWYGLIDVEVSIDGLLGENLQG